MNRTVAGRTIARLAAATALAASLMLGVGTAPVSAAVPGSGGVNDWTCQPSAAHPQPVVVLHGLGATAAEDTGMYLAPLLAATGYCTFTVTYGATSGFGPLVGGVGHVAASGRQIGAFVDHVLASTHATKVDLVGHSEGAFLSLYVPKVTGYAGKVANVVALAPPTHGTTFSNLVTIGDLLGLRPEVDAVLNGGGCQACDELIVGGSAVTQLDTGPIAQSGVGYTVLASRSDELVTPTATAFVEEPGVHNAYVQDTCPLDPVGHIGEAYDPDVAQMILNALDPATARPVACSFGAPL
ncbi:MAG: esterase/lipase family protein [Acidimicrobiales bacterium]